MPKVEAEDFMLIIVACPPQKEVRVYLFRALFLPSNQDIFVVKKYDYYYHAHQAAEVSHHLEKLVLAACAVLKMENTRLGQKRQREREGEGVEGALGGPPPQTERAGKGRGGDGGSSKPKC